MCDTCEGKESKYRIYTLFCISGSFSFKNIDKHIKICIGEVIQIVNNIKSRPLQSRIFKQLCISMDEKYERLLLHP